MNYIKKKYVVLLWIIVGIILLFICLGALVNNFFLIMALATVALYLYISVNKLKCPYCDRTENLERISYAINHVYYCRHCGKAIEVK